MIRQAKLKILIAILLLSFFSLGAKPPPHENPYSAPEDFGEVVILFKYSETFSYVLGKNPAWIERLMRKALQANIPSDLKDKINLFLSSGHTLAQLTPLIDEEIDKTQTFLSQFRLNEAEETKKEARELLLKGYRELEAMEEAFFYTARRLHADTAPPGSPLRQAYEDVKAKLAQVRSSLDLKSSMLHSLGKQAEEIKVEKLHPTALTLEVKPERAFVGEEIGFQGKLSSGENPLAGRKITLLFNKAPLMEIETDEHGNYRGKLSLPYEYKSQALLQTIYYPRGEDIGLYLGSSSPQITIKVLFYQTTLTPEISRPAYPGRNLPIKGRLEYVQTPTPQSRQLLVYWDGRLMKEEMVGEDFSLKLPISATETLGRHYLGFYIAPQGRYAPTYASAEVEVTQAIPSVALLKAPKTVFTPFGFEIEGRAFSPLGSLQNAEVKVALGGWQKKTLTDKEGVFRTHLDTGINLTLMGWEGLEIDVLPSEPWHSRGYSSAKILIINPINIGGLALALIALGFAARPRLKRMVLTPTPALKIPAEVPLPKPEAATPRREKTEESPLLSLYRLVLGLVQKALGVMLLPHQTLREFARQCAPQLGPLGKFLEELTYLVERLLYSPHTLRKEELDKAREISRKLEKGLR